MRKKSFKKSLVLILAVLMFAAPLTACGNKEKKGEENGEAVSDYVYVANYATMDKAVTEMNTPYAAGGTIYFSASIAVHSDGSLVTENELKEIDEYYANLYGDGAIAEAAAFEGEADTAEAESADIPVIDFDIQYISGLYSVKIDGTGYTALSDYVSPAKLDNSDSYSGLDKIIADEEGNIWVAEYVGTTLYDLPPDFDPAKDDMWEYYAGEERQNFVRKLSSTGAEMSSVDLSQFIEKSEPDMSGYSRQFYISDMTMDGEGNIYISDGDSTVYVIGKDGSFQFKLSLDTWINRLIKIGDGRVGTTSYGDSGGMVLKLIDFDAKSWGAEMNIPSEVWDTSPGGDVYDFCYTDGSSLYGYSFETETKEKILNWINSDVDNNTIQFSTVLDNGNVFAIASNWENEDGPSYEVITMVKTPRSEVKQKTTISLATMYLDYELRKQILSFNKTNPDYRIEVKDYSEFGTEEDWNAGLTKLNTEIISGKAPDIISISNLPYQQYAAKGLLVDLYSFIDNDPDISRDDFIKSIAGALETEGKLYQVSPSFSVISIVGSPSILGSEMGWTIDEMQAVIDANPNADLPMGQYVSRESVLQMLCMLNMENYMNWQTGETSFNSDDFKKLLSFANTFPSQEDMEKFYESGEWIDSSVLIQEGRQIFETFSASDFYNYQYYKAMFGGEIVFKGFPSDEKNGNVASFDSGISMTTSCKEKEGAWQFMRSILSDEYQENLGWNFPIMQKAFDKRLEKEMVQEYYTDGDGNKVPVSHGGMSMGDGPMIEFYAITKEEAEQIKALINSVENTAVYDESVLNIINEEAAFFFAGEKTVDQTAEVIQSRMNIYINEQR